VTWTGDYLVGSTATGTFSLSNSGNSTATGINYTSGVNRLSVQPPATVAAGGLGTVTANMTAVTSGKRSGVVTITSSQGSASVVVLLNFYDDINSSVTGLVEELASMKGQLTASQQTALASAFSDIDDDINSATGAQSSGNYQSALDYYNRAAAKKESLSNALSAGFTPVTPVAPSAPIDMSTIIIIVAVVAIVVLVVFVIKKRRAGGKDVEEELAEEFGPVESGA
jgi:subtilase family serine protease